MYSVKFAKFFRTIILKNIFERLLLEILYSLNLNVSQCSYLTDNEWTHLAVFRFIFNLLFKKKYSCRYKQTSEVKTFEKIKLNFFFVHSHNFCKKMKQTLCIVWNVWFNLIITRFRSSLQYSEQKAFTFSIEGFLIQMFFLNKVDIYPKHFIFTGEKHFSLRKELKWITKTMHKKCTKKCTKSYFIAKIFTFVITLFFYFISLVLLLQFKDLFIIKTIFQILHPFAFF